jgi:tetratricopeptide (TPR) repeat protein
VRRFFTPSTIVPVAIITTVSAMIAVANLRSRESRASYGRQANSRPMTMGTRGAGTGRADLARRIVELRAAVTSRPEDAGAAVMLADALVRQTRISGNSGLAIEAETALRRVLADEPANYDANRQLGSLLLSQHRFREAVAAGEKNRQARPDDAMNYGIIGDGHLELGEYDQAFAAFDRMMTLRPSAASYARVAYARELQGDLSGAVQSMKLAADATSPGDPEALAWHHAQLGDLYQRLGKTHEAETEYIAASHAFPGHPFAMMGYARFLSARGEPSSALTLLQELAKTAPTPDLAARTGDLLAALGRRDEAERQFALAEAGWRVDAPEPKNLVRFLADHDRRIPDAVTIAEKASAERHDIFTEDALAWAYYKAGRIADARGAIAQALRTGTKDADIRAHALAIEAAAGRAAR